MLSNIWAAVVMMIPFGLIVWNMIKLDRRTPKNKIFEEEEEPVKRSYDQLAPMYKINFISDKLFELQKMNLCPCDIKMKSLSNRLKKLQDISEKLTLQNYDEDCKCREALMWLERPEKNRWCDPPSIIQACDPLTEQDLKLTTKLTELPIDLSKDVSKVKRPCQSIGTVTDEKFDEVSIPLVDKWINRALMSLTHYLDLTIDTSIVKYYLVLNYVPKIVENTKAIIKYLRRAIIISTQILGANTTVTIDIMQPRDGVLWKNGVPVVVATGPPRTVKKLCCTPVRYIPAKKVD